jgi:hypothetical protein
MSDVCIIGIGIHPFGRTEGRSGIDQGVFAVRAALADAGIEWPHVQFAYGASDAAGNPDTMIDRLGLTGVQFINVRNGCAAGGSALFSVQMAIKSGEYDIGLAVGFDKHPRGAFNAMPADYGLPDWYGEAGYMITTQFFAAKITRYMHLHGISPASLGRVAEKAFRNAVHAPHAWRREPVPLATIMAAPLVSDPYTKYMFCSPAEGGVALVLASEKKARELGRPLVRLKAVTMRTRPPGSFEVFAPSIDVIRGGCASSGILPSRSCRIPRPGPRSCILPKTGSAAMASKNNGWPKAGPKFTAHCRSTPTAAALPAENRLARRDCGRCMRMSSSFAATAVGGRSPAPRKPPTAMSMARPAYPPSP